MSPDTSGGFERAFDVLRDRHTAEPERLVVIPRVADSDPPRYLFARWPDWPHPAMLALDPPGTSETLDEALASMLGARMAVRPSGPAQPSDERVPVRMSHARRGADGIGWLRPVRVDVTPIAGEPEPDGLLEGVEPLTLDDALRALPTDVERQVLRLAVGV